jgi:tetratricopeptide (TPR) repeat protein
MRRMKAAAAAIGLAALCGLAATAQGADEATSTWTQCHSSTNEDARIAACTHELEQFPSSTDTKADLYDNRGLAHLEKSEFDAALADIGKAITNRADDGALYFHRGLIYLRMGDHALALRDFDIALARSPDLADALVARGHEHLYAHDNAKALADLNRAVRLYPQYPDAYAERCFVQAAIGADLVGALRDCATAIRLAPDAVEFVQTRAFAEYRAKALDKALADLDAALAKQPGAANALFLKGVIERDRGDAAKGKADMDAALAAAPHVAQGWAAFGVN